MLVNANIGLGGGSFNHVPGGGNVLYLDGHVTFIRYGRVAGLQDLGLADG